MIGLPTQLVALLRAHCAEQQLNRVAARQLWHDEGWVFATPIGEPINPRTDYNEGKRLLKRGWPARVAATRREAHGRHCAAGPAPADADSHVANGLVQRIHGRRYQHVTDALRSQVASQVGELIWDSPPDHDGQAVLSWLRPAGVSSGSC